MAIQSTFSVSKELGTADLVYTEDSAVIAEFHYSASGYTSPLRNEIIETLAEFVGSVADLRRWRQLVDDTFGLPTQARATHENTFKVEITPNERAVLKHTIGGTQTTYRFRFSTGNVTVESRAAIAANRVQFGLWVEALDFAAGEFARLAKLAPLT